jgi:hypothetical protein
MAWIWALKALYLVRSCLCVCVCVYVCVFGEGEGRTGLVGWSRSRLIWYGERWAHYRVHSLSNDM